MTGRAKVREHLLKESGGAQSTVESMTSYVRRVLRRVASKFSTNMPEHSRELLLRMLPADAVGAEIGVHEGDFSRRILDVLKPRRMHLIDPWQYQTGEEFAEAYYGGKAKGGQTQLDKRYLSVLQRFKPEIQTGQVEVHRALSNQVAVQFPDEYFDFVYIDGDHRYAAVKEDLELYFNKLKVRGLLCGDDYGEAGWWSNGVKRAVDGFASNNAVKILSLEHYQFVLEKAQPAAK
jgi:hypothetical protein